MVLYELLTGRRPFVGSKSEIIESIERDAPTRPKDLITDIPEKLDEITRKCLQKNPDDVRFQSSTQSFAPAAREWLESTDRIPSPRDFSGFLQEKRANFSDRPWLFDEVDFWAVRPNERVLLITGDLGTGKSAFISELICRNLDRRVLAFHCCQHDTPKTLRPACFVRNLAGMLAENVGGYRRANCPSRQREALVSRQCCESDPAGAFELGVIRALNKVPRQANELGYIVIDALDESLGAQGPAPTIVDLLAARMQRLPGWLRLIVTTRKDPEILQAFSGARPLAIDRDSQQHADEVDADLQRFIAARLNEANFQERLAQARLAPEDAIRILSAKSEGSFLYVTQALQGIERDLYALNSHDELPPGHDEACTGNPLLQGPFPARNELYRAAHRVRGGSCRPEPSHGRPFCGRDRY